MCGLSLNFYRRMQNLYIHTVKMVLTYLKPTICNIIRDFFILFTTRVLKGFEFMYAEN